MNWKWKDFNWKWKDFNWKWKDLNWKCKDLNWKWKDLNWKWKDFIWKCKDFDGKVSSQIARATDKNENVWKIDFQNKKDIRGHAKNGWFSGEKKKKERRGQANKTMIFVKIKNS